MNRSILSVALLFAAILTQSSCKPVNESNPWLIIVGNDSFALPELKTAWAELDISQRDSFLSSEVPSESFIESFIGKMVLLHELEYSGYLSAPSTIAFGEAWLRLENAILVSRLIQSKITDNLTVEDIERYTTMPPDKVWFTEEPGTVQETTHLSMELRALPLDIYDHLVSLNPGSSGMNAQGTAIRLDSIAYSDPLPDTDSRDGSADAFHISMERSRLFMSRTLQSASREYSLSVDSSLLKMFALQMLDHRQDEIIVHSSYRNWNAAELLYEVNFLDSRMPVQHNSFEWLDTLVESMILYGALLEYSETFYPEKLDSLLIEKDSYFLDLALDLMYKEQISDKIVVDSSDIEEQYALLQEPFMFEERRVLETAILPDDRLTELEHYSFEGIQAEVITGLQPLERLSDNNLTPQISRPMRLVEIPAHLGDTVFLLAASDTLSWHGPFPIDEVDGSILFRLAGVVPSRMAEMDEITYDLSVMARKRLEEQAVTNWIVELREKHGVIINEEVLHQLPASPDLW
ncbi:MAG: hypothetical protein U9P42_02970 [Candidatus Fermentibacteria bacterium]|nr:hypothetical protein [Candidatus Fermentibacteria bacterium]